MSEFINFSKSFELLEQNPHFIKEQTVFGIQKDLLKKEKRDDFRTHNQVFLANGGAKYLLYKFVVQDKQFLGMEEFKFLNFFFEVCSQEDVTYVINNVISNYPITQFILAMMIKVNKTF